MTKHRHYRGPDDDYAGFGEPPEAVVDGLSDNEGVQP